MLAGFAPLALWAGAILALPPLGAWLAGQPLGQHLQVPLSARPFDPLPFSVPVFWASAALAAGLILCVLWLASPRRASRPAPSPATPAPSVTRLPAWGWAGWLGIGLAAALPELGLVLPLLGLILLVNGHSQRRTGSSLLTRRPGFVAVMLPAGMLLGWLYHWLNLHLQLWHYPDAGAPLPFVLLRSLEYALLLPAVLSLRQWLARSPSLLGITNRGRPIGEGAAATGLGWALLGLAGIGLAGATVWPDWIYPLTWTAPLLLAIGLGIIAGRPSAFAGVRDGDWSRVLLPAGAALLLGVTLQLWGSLFGTPWTLTLPLLDGARVLGLPAIAYLGFLPLGLLAIWLADQLARPWRRRPLQRFPKFPVKVVIKS